MLTTYVVSWIIFINQSRQRLQLYTFFNPPPPTTLSFVTTLLVFPVVLHALLDLVLLSSLIHISSSSTTFLCFQHSFIYHSLLSRRFSVLFRSLWSTECKKIWSEIKLMRNAWMKWSREPHHNMGAFIFPVYWMTILPNLKFARQLK
jgi:hypothetical protein